MCVDETLIVGRSKKESSKCTERYVLLHMHLLISHERRMCSTVNSNCSVHKIFVVKNVSFHVWLGIWYVALLWQMYARHADFLAACVGQGFEMVWRHSVAMSLLIPGTSTRHLAIFLDWVLSHLVHFTVHRLDLFVFICVYFVLLFFLLHICCVIVSTVGWT